jgi:hypothetical protein
MNLKESANPSYNPRERVENELSVTQPGEQLICHVKRHPIGIIGIYVAIVFLLFVFAVLAFILVPSTFGDTGGDQAQRYATGIFAILAVGGLLYAMAATYVYWGNRWVVTSDSLTQISQVSLFGRQSSQLALANIEDVTAEQNGILTHIFHYGLLKVETAGEHSKFHFPYCPNPNFYAKKILEAREALGQNVHALHPQAHGSNNQLPYSYTAPPNPGSNSPNNPA